MENEIKIRRPLSRTQLVAMLRELLSNGDEVVEAWNKGRTPPPFRTHNGITIYHRPTDPAFFLLQEIFMLRCYTGESFYFPQPNDAVIDCGANMGMFALFLSHLEPRVKIYCFEPSRSTFEQLRWNIRRNNLTHFIHPHRLGIWGNKTRKMLLTSQSSGRRSFFLQPEIHLKESFENVFCVTLQDVFTLYSFRTVDFVKIDVEGAELDIIENTDRATWNKVVRVAVEYHETLRPGSRDRLITHLAGCGFDHITIVSEPDLLNTIGIIQATRSLAKPTGTDI